MTGRPSPRNGHPDTAPPPAAGPAADRPTDPAPAAGPAAPTGGRRHAADRAGWPTDPRPSTPRRDGVPRWARVVGELVAASLVAVLVSVAIQFVVARLPIPPSTNVGLALTATGGLAVAMVLALAGLVHRARPALTAPLAWVGLSALSTVPLALLLATTRHYLFGVSGDQAFRVQYLTRFADSARLSDFAYADLPPYYPAGWFWVGGRLAALFGVEPWAFYKPFAITTMALTGVLAYVLWSLVAGRVRALGFATATALAGLALAAYTPYSWLTAALVPPVAVLGLRLVRRHGAWVRTALLTGLVLGVAAVTHTQIFFFLGFVLAALAMDGLVRTRGGAVGRLLVTAVVVLLGSLPLVLLNWGPYLLGWLGGGPTYSAGQRFLPESGALFALPMLEPTALGALTLAGTVWIVLRFRRDPVARALGFTAVCAYAWYLLSTLALVADTTLLSFRIEPILAATLACGAVGLAADAVRTARDRFPGRDLARSLPALVAVLAAVAVVAGVQTTPETYSWSTSAQNGDYYPDGTRPTGARTDTDAGARNAELASTVDELTGRPADQVVVLSSSYALLSYHPYWSYQTTIAQYANPLADFPARSEQVRRWAAAATPAQLLDALDTGPARPPSVFVFGRAGDGRLQMGISSDRFPQQGSRSETVTFDPGLFDDPAFVRRDVGPFTVVVRPDVPPVG